MRYGTKVIWDGVSDRLQRSFKQRIATGDEKLEKSKDSLLEVRKIIEEMEAKRLGQFEEVELEIQNVHNLLQKMRRAL